MNRERRRWRLVNLDKREQLKIDGYNLKNEHSAAWLFGQGVLDRLMELLRVPRFTSELLMSVAYDDYAYTERSVQTNCRLLGLPMELLEMVEDEVKADEVDTVCLALTCRFFWFGLREEVGPIVIKDAAPWANDRLLFTVNDIDRVDGASNEGEDSADSMATVSWDGFDESDEEESIVHSHDHAEEEGTPLNEDQIEDGHLDEEQHGESISVQEERVDGPDNGEAVSPVAELPYAQPWPVIRAVRGRVQAGYATPLWRLLSAFDFGDDEDLVLVCPRYSQYISARTLALDLLHEYSLGEIACALVIDDGEDAERMGRWSGEHLSITALSVLQDAEPNVANITREVDRDWFYRRRIPFRTAEETKAHRYFWRWHTRSEDPLIYYDCGQALWRHHDPFEDMTAVERIDMQVQLRFHQHSIEEAMLKLGADSHWITPGA